MNKKQLFCAFLILFLGFAAVAGASNNLEIPDYPSFLGYQAISSTSTISEVLIWIFYAALAISGLVVFGSLVYGGFKYQTSLGNPSSQKDAIDRIVSSLLGLVILLSSYLILTTINPQLTRFALVKTAAQPVTFDQGIFVRYRGTGGTLPIRRFLGSVEDFGVARNKINQVRIVPPPAGQGSPYSIILHEEAKSLGDCLLYSSVTGEITTITLNPEPKLASMTVFLKADMVSYGGVQICSQADPGPDTPCIGFEGNGSCTSGDCNDPNNYWKDIGTLDSRLRDNVWSIIKDGPYLVVLRGDSTGCMVFHNSVPDLKGYDINKCDQTCFLFWCRYKSCARKVAVFPLNNQLPLIWK